MIKFFRNFRHRLLRENKFSRYLIYAVGEIILVVIGILIALQINNWNEKRKEQQRAAELHHQLYNELAKAQDTYILVQQSLDNYVEFLEYLIVNWQSLHPGDLRAQLEQRGYGGQPLSLLIYISWYSQFNDVSKEIYNKSVSEGSISLIDPEFVVYLSNVYEAKASRLNEFIQQEYQLAQNITNHISLQHGQVFSEGERTNSKDWEEETYRRFLGSIENDGSLRFLLDSKLQLNKARSLLISWQIDNIQNTLDQFPPAKD